MQHARSLVNSNKNLRSAVEQSKLFLKRQPLLVKAAPTAIGFAFGDVLTQYMNAPQRHQRMQSHDWSRTAKMALVGGVLAAPVLLGFMRGLDSTVFAANPNSPVAHTLKFVLDQIVGCVIWQAAYCTIHPPYKRGLVQFFNSTMQGQTERVRRRLHVAPAAAQPTAPAAAHSSGGCQVIPHHH